MPSAVWECIEKAKKKIQSVTAIRENVQIPIFITHTFLYSVM
jgi:hypothetical protein